MAANQEHVKQAGAQYQNAWWLEMKQSERFTGRSRRRTTVGQDVGWCADQGHIAAQQRGKGDRGITELRWRGFDFFGDGD